MEEREAMTSTERPSQIITGEAPPVTVDPLTSSSSERPTEAAAVTSAEPERPSEVIVGGGGSGDVVVAAAVTSAMAVGPPEGAKKKRGRPRKYAPDGTPVMPLSPMPLAASLPPGDYIAAAAALSRGRARSAGYVSKKLQQQLPRFELQTSSAEIIACAAGANFTPHIITVAAGEDVTMKIISFSQQGPRAICILSGNGIISNVTLGQADSSGGTMTYEGRFELLSLSGSFMPSENAGTRSRSGGMSVSLASPDGRVVGGAVAGLLVAASPVKVIVGSFLPSYELEQNPKKSRYDTTPISVPTFTEGRYGGNGQGHPSSIPKQALITSSSFRGDSWSASPHSGPDGVRNMGTDMNISVTGS